MVVDDSRAPSLKMLDLRIKQVADMQTNLASKVDDIKSKLGDPPDGLYLRTAQLRSDIDTIDERINKITADISQLLAICEEQTRQVIIFENLLQKHSVRDDELHDDVNKLTQAMGPITKDFDLRMGIKKWTDKIIWAIITLFFTGAVSFLKVTYDDAKEKDEQLQKIQSMLQKQNESE
jgi:chromosome segregation ATPase